jgi:hypothetical protein
MAEDYRWWWTSFSASGSSGIYVFLYSVMCGWWVDGVDGVDGDGMMGMLYPVLFRGRKTWCDWWWCVPSCLKMSEVLWKFKYMYIYITYAFRRVWLSASSTIGSHVGSLASGVSLMEMELSKLCPWIPQQWYASAKRSMLCTWTLDELRKDLCQSSLALMYRHSRSLDGTHALHSFGKKCAYLFSYHLLSRKLYRKTFGTAEWSFRQVRQ